ncbi:MAG: hypothetical protein OHK003_20140 [Anaerolineales bacterium]
MAYNFGLTAHDYAKYRAGFPNDFFERVFNEKIVREGDALVDLGTGTGALAREFAARGCQVIGVDISAQLLEQAQAQKDAEGNPILQIPHRVFVIHVKKL